jgi:hypothetical protein
MKWAILLALVSTCWILTYASRPKPVEPVVMPANMPTVQETRAILLDCERYEVRQCIMIAVPVPDFSTAMRGE